MTFQVMESLCVRGSPVMEDRMGWGDNFLFVIDGASGLTGAHVTSAGSDAAWLAEGLRLGLEKLLPQSPLPLDQLLSQIGSQLKAEYDAFGKQAAPPDYPSAGLAVLRLRGDTLEYFGLGDCSVSVELADGTVEAQEETRLPLLDQRALDQMAQLCRETGCTMPEARRQLNDVLIQNRNLRNRPEGYWIFDLSGAAIPHARQKSWPAAQVRTVAAMSDGFSQLIQPFGFARDLPELHRKLKEGSLADLSGELFSRQRADSGCLRYPRFKTRDDTTALWAALV